MKQPTYGNIRRSIEVLYRWERMARGRGKTVAAEETKRIREILEYFEKYGKLDSC